MMNIVLDANIIISYPKLLGLSIKDVRLIVPLDVVKELSERDIFRGGSYNDRIALIEKGRLEETIVIANTDSSVYQQYHEDLKLYLKAGLDISAIVVALNLKNEGEEVKIATVDKVLSNIANANGIAVLTKTEIEKLLVTFEEPKTLKSFLKLFIDVLLDVSEQLLLSMPIFGFLLVPLFKKMRHVGLPSLKDQIVLFERKETSNLIAGIFIGVIFTLLGGEIYFNFNFIASKINVWGTIILTVLLGVVLFIFREKRRLEYGVFEILVGVASIYLIFDSDKFDYSKIHFTPDFSIKVAAGLYIMVRGQDNVVKAIKNTKLGVKLQKYGIGI